MKSSKKNMKEIIEIIKEKKIDIKISIILINLKK
jgi:hypothetical protein